MLPDHVLSTQVIFGQYLTPDGEDPSYLVDYEYGGIGISDPSAGLRYQIWTARLTRGVNGFAEIYISAPNTPEFLAYSDFGITTVSLAFDQNMKQALAFLQEGVAKLWWYDTTIPGYVLISLPAGTNFPKLCLDDKRFEQTATSDILLTYTRAGVLYFREQRDRFLIEYELRTDVVGDVLQFGMTEVNRVQWAVGLLDYPVGLPIHRAVTGGRRRRTTQGDIRKVVGASYG